MSKSVITFVRLDVSVVSCAFISILGLLLGILMPEKMEDFRLRFPENNDECFIFRFMWYEILPPRRIDRLARAAVARRSQVNFAMIISPAFNGYALM